MQEMSSHPVDPGAAVPAVILDEPAYPAHSVCRSSRHTECAGYIDDVHLMRRHREMLVLACVIIVLSFVLIVRSDDHAAFALLPNWPIPSTCPSQTIFGVDCPGCGLTRSFIFLAHGDWHSAFVRNRVGWLLALAVIVQIPYRLFALLGRDRQPLGRRIPQVFGYVLIAALIGNWVLHLVGV